MSEVFNSIEQGLVEAIEFSKGKDVAANLYSPTPIDLKALRKRVGMTQREFAGTFGIALGTLRHWERGDRSPKGAALVLLNLVSKDPNAVLEILNRK